LYDPSNTYKTVRDFDHLLVLINHVLSTAPRWTDAGHSVGIVGVPVNAILDWPMATKAGFTAFQDPKVNQLVSRLFSDERCLTISLKKC
jgi:phosphatidylserine decarboxylase